MWQLHKESLVLWGWAVSLGTDLQDCTSQQWNSFTDGWRGIMHCPCAELDWYPINTSQSHAAITPLLYHQCSPYAWPMVIFSQSCVSNIITLTLPVQTLVLVSQCWEWSLYNLHASSTSSCEGVPQIQSMGILDPLGHRVLFCVVLKYVGTVKWLTNQLFYSIWSIGSRIQSN